MLPNQLDLAARIGVLIARAAGDEQRRDARIRRLEVLLGVARVVAAEEVEPDRRVVARVAEQHGPQLAVGARHPQNGHRMFDRPIRMRSVRESLLGRPPPIHGETTSGPLVVELGGGQGRQCVRHQRRQFFEELLGVVQRQLQPRLDLLGRAVERHAVHTQLRAAVRVGRVEQQRFGRQSMLVLHGLFEPFPQRPRHSNQILRHDHKPPARGVFDRQRFRV